MRTPEEYRESLRRMRPNVHKFGELIRDVTTHPATRRVVEGHARLFGAAMEEGTRELLTTTSSLTGEPISRYLSLIRGPEDMLANLRLKRLAFHLTGTCTGGRCVGWTALNAMWAATFEMDGALGTDYHGRLRDWLIEKGREDIALCGALTDPKGDRGLGPREQPDPDLNLHIAKVRDDGVVVRGAKVMIAGAAAANEVFVLPGARYGEDEEDYAVSFAIPRDAEGLTVVEARRPSDTREAEDGFDIPVERGGITQGYLFFEDVFVPRRRVFMCGEAAFTGAAVLSFVGPYRAAMGGCVAGQGDVMLGAAALMSRANGLSDRTFSEKLVRMAVNNETTFALGAGAGALGRRHPSGVWLPDTLAANVNKVHVATLPQETRRLLQEISGGIGETGCLPSHRDFTDERLGPLVRKYLRARSGAEARARAARLVEWLTIGAGVPGCLHGGGSPDAARLLIRGALDIDGLVGLAAGLAGVGERLEDPGRARAGKR
ncbi:MAG: 4-hydroxyphenylacetate 3-hydroxylase N-terminal domain-containing protein [Thermoplasmatota archaeon]